MNYFGDIGAGNERSAGGSSSSSSSRKGKKSHSDKPKQPQRGLGVAQLEKIRLHNQLGFHPNTLHPQMGMGELERSHMIYGQSQPSSDPRWNGTNVMFEAQNYQQPDITRHLFQVEVDQDSLRKNKRKTDSMGSNNHNSESNDSQELDLELRL